MKQMRQQREKLSAKIVDMSYEEQRAYLDKLLQSERDIKKEQGY